MRKSFTTKVRRAFKQDSDNVQTLSKVKYFYEKRGSSVVCENVLIKKSVTHLSNLLESYNVWRKMNLPMTDTMRQEKLFLFIDIDLY